MTFTYLREVQRTEDGRELGREPHKNIAAALFPIGSRLFPHSTILSATPILICQRDCMYLVYICTEVGTNPMYVEYNP